MIEDLVYGKMEGNISLGGGKKEQSINSSSRTKNSSRGDWTNVKERTMQDRLCGIKEEKKSMLIVYYTNRQDMTT